MRWLVGAAANGVIGGIQGNRRGIRDGWSEGSRSVAGCWGRPGSRVSTAVFSEPPRGPGRLEYGAVTPASRPC